MEKSPQNPVEANVPWYYNSPSEYQGDRGPEEETSPEKQAEYLFKEIEGMLNKGYELKIFRTGSGNAVVISASQEDLAKAEDVAKAEDMANKFTALLDATMNQDRKGGIMKAIARTLSFNGAIVTAEIDKGITFDPFNVVIDGKAFRTPVIPLDVQEKLRESKEPQPFCYDGIDYTALLYDKHKIGTRPVDESDAYYQYRKTGRGSSLYAAIATALVSIEEGPRHKQTS